VIGGGVVGLYTSLYLSRAGFDVILIDREDICSSTSNKFHGMIHSGARYAVTDPVSAAECASENEILSRIASSYIDDVGGYFIALNESESDFGDRLIKGCRKARISTKETDIGTLKQSEPFVTPNVQRAIHVPDKVVKAFEYCVAIAMESILEGTKIMTYSEVIGMIIADNHIEKIRVRRDGRITELSPDIVINAAGPFSDSINAMAGIDIPATVPALGAMLVYPLHAVNSVLNRMRAPSDGDIIVPYGSLAIAGTTAVISPDTENPGIDLQDLENMQSDIVRMVPILSSYRYSRYYFSFRPLMEGSSDSLRTSSRSFRILTEEYHGIHNYFAITGGKFTTGRLIGETVQRTVCEKLGSKRPHGDLDLNSTVERFVESPFCRDRKLFDRLVKRLNGIDDERLSTAIIAALYKNIGDEKIGF